MGENKREQWSAALHCMAKLHGLVPYGISVGNHDMTGAGDLSLFQEAFRFISSPAFPGSRANWQIRER
jgi:hypothetical protein